MQVSYITVQSAAEGAGVASVVKKIPYIFGDTPTKYAVEICENTRNILNY